MKQVFECQVCGSTKSRLVIDMGLTPLVNTLPPVDLDPPVDCVYDLALIQCEACTLVQLRFAPDMESVFPESYPYLSGLTTPLVKNFQSQALDVVKFLREKFTDKHYKFLDVGSNDGSLLKCYSYLGCDVYLTLVALHKTGMVEIPDPPSHLSTRQIPRIDRRTLPQPPRRWPITPLCVGLGRT